MRETDWTKVLGWPGCQVYRHEINESAKTLKLWVRRKRRNWKLVCSGCGRKLSEVYDTYERKVRDLPCFEYRTTVVIELYRVRCPDCGIKAEKVPLLPSKAPFSRRFEEAVGQAGESAAGRPVARQFGLARASMLKKVLDTADIVRDGLFTATIHRVREAASLPLLEPTALLQWPDQPRNIHPNKPLLVVVGTDQVRGIVRYRQRGGVDWTLML